MEKVNFIIDEILKYTISNNGNIHIKKAIEIAKKAGVDDMSLITQTLLRYGNTTPGYGRNIWDYFYINDIGINFISNGGFKGRALNNEKQNRRKKREMIEKWVIPIIVAILGVILTVILKG